MNTSTQHHVAGHTMPGQGNAGIAKIDPAECDPARADCGSAASKAGGDKGPDIAADVKKHEQGHAKPERAVETNPIDEAAWESFPASDPPSSNPGTSTPAS
jgi:hypothetical protein